MCSKLRIQQLNCFQVVFLNGRQHIYKITTNIYFDEHEHDIQMYKYTSWLESAAKL